MDIAIRSSTYQPKTYVNMEQLKSENILLSNHKGRFYTHPQFSSHPDTPEIIRANADEYVIIFSKRVFRTREHSAYAYKIWGVCDKIHSFGVKPYIVRWPYTQRFIIMQSWFCNFYVVLRTNTCNKLCKVFSNVKQFSENYCVGTFQPSMFWLCNLYHKMFANST